jgi:Coenzyme PQQ synthesis protein D (PqqD)
VLTKRRREVNLLALRPVRNVPWETSAEGRVVLIAPKFRNRFLVRVLVPLLKHPTMKLTLDGIGSDIWALCDGETDVGVIARRLADKYGGETDPGCDRLGRFFKALERERLVIMVQ